MHAADPFRPRFSSGTFLNVRSSIPISIAIGLALTTGACHRRHAAPAPVPSAPLPAPPSETPPPPQLPPQPPQQPPPGQQTPGETLPPAGTQAPATHRTHHRAHHKPSTPAAAETAPKPGPAPAASATPPQPPAAPLQLGAILTPEQRRALVEAIDASTARARHNLSVISIYHLTPSQTETANQIRSFLRQAQATRDSDPEAARSLAERADLLSRDLLQSVQ